MLRRRCNTINSPSRLNIFQCFSVFFLASACDLEKESSPILAWTPQILSVLSSALFPSSNNRVSLKNILSVILVLLHLSYFFHQSYVLCSLFNLFFCKLLLSFSVLLKTNYLVTLFLFKTFPRFSLPFLFTLNRSLHFICKT